MFSWRSRKRLCSDVAKLASFDLVGVEGFCSDKLDEIQDCLADLIFARRALDKIVVRTDSDLRSLASRVDSIQSGIQSLVNLVTLYMAHVSSIIQNTARIPGVSVNAATPVAGLHSSPLPCGKGPLASGCTRSDILKN